MTDCLLNIYIKQTDYSIWKIYIIDSTYNYSPSVNNTQHSEYQQSTNNEITAIYSLYTSDIPLCSILVFLIEQNKQTCISRHEIYNRIAKFKKLQLGDLTYIEVLILELTSDDNWALYYHTNTEGHVCLLFLVSDNAIKLIYQNPDVIFINAIY